MPLSKGPTARLAPLNGKNVEIDTSWLEKTGEYLVFTVDRHDPDCMEFVTATATPALATDCATSAGVNDDRLALITRVERVITKGARGSYTQLFAPKREADATEPSPAERHKDNLTQIFRAARNFGAGFGTCATFIGLLAIGEALTR